MSKLLSGRVWCRFLRFASEVGIEPDPDLMALVKLINIHVRHVNDCSTIAKYMKIAQVKSTISDYKNTSSLHPGPNFLLNVRSNRLIKNYNDLWLLIHYGTAFQ